MYIVAPYKKKPLLIDQDVEADLPRHTLGHTIWQYNLNEDFLAKHPELKGQRVGVVGSLRFKGTAEIEADQELRQYYNASVTEALRAVTDMGNLTTFAGDTLVFGVTATGRPVPLSRGLASALWSALPRH